MLKTTKILFQCYIKLDKHVSKKNRKRVAKNRATGKAFIRTDTQTKCELDYLTLLLLKQKANAGIVEPINQDVSIAFIFHYKANKAGTPTKKYLDMSNAYQGPEDCLQEAGIIADDKLIANHNGSQRILDANEVGLEIIIKSI